MGGHTRGVTCGIVPGAEGGGEGRGGASGAAAAGVGGGRGAMPPIATLVRARREGDRAGEIERGEAVAG